MGGSGNSHEKEHPLGEMDENIAKTVKESILGDSTTDDRLADLDIPPVTESYYINELIAVAIAVADGTLEKDILLEKIKNLQLKFFEAYRNFLTIYAESELPEIIDKEAKKILQSFEDLEAAISELLHYFEDESLLHIKNGLESLEASFNRMTIANKNFTRYQQAMGGKLCPECEFINLPGEIYCKKCKFVFVMPPEEIYKEFQLITAVDLEGEIESGGLLFPKHLGRLYDNYHRMSRNDISLREFITEIDWLLALLNRTKLKTEKVLFKETIGKARDSIIYTGWALMDGLNIVNVSMNKIRLCLLTFDSSKMQEGWTELLYGTRKIMQGGPFYPLIDKQAIEDGKKLDEELKIFDESG